ncbi:methionyl-tRNA formyltransferase [Orrella sp. 11846]|uniref:methionyl-tRNA formyltransferase n=1 Tax=Orrella sp. 11846 TaxID=3409913 RepID=UPI003B5A7316
MRIGFAGTPEFASTVLETLIARGYQINVVLTQPDRPSGRGMKLTPSPVKALAQSHGLTVLQPVSLRLDGRHPQDAQDAQTALQALNLDVLIVVAYGLILPAWVLQMPRYGCLNIHASLLPRWRGAAPIQRAIEAGDTHTGITIMQMDEGLDTGDMLLIAPLEIEPSDNAQRLHDRLATLACTTIVQALEKLQAGELQPQPQPEEGVTYAEKLNREESHLDLSAPASELIRKVRAFDPFPGARLSLPGIDEPVRVFDAQVVSDDGVILKPGSLVAASAQGIDVMTGDGILRILELQRAGARRQAAASFLQGWRTIPEMGAPPVES